MKRCYSCLDPVRQGTVLVLSDRLSYSSNRVLVTFCKDCMEKYNFHLKDWTIELKVRDE